MSDAEYSEVKQTDPWEELDSHYQHIKGFLKEIRKTDRKIINDLVADIEQLHAAKAEACKDLNKKIEDLQYENERLTKLNLQIGDSAAQNYEALNFAYNVLTSLPAIEHFHTAINKAIDKCNEAFDNKMGEAFHAKLTHAEQERNKMHEDWLKEMSRAIHYKNMCRSLKTSIEALMNIDKELPGDNSD